MKDFKKLKVWQMGMDIANETYLFTGGFPNNEKFGLCNQLTRAAISIPSNIAEGSSRSSDKDYARFVEIALGSCFEAESQILVATRLNYGDQVIGNKLLILLDQEQKMLIAFLKNLRKKPEKSTI